MPAINSRCRQWHKPSFLLLDSFRPVFRQVLKSCTFLFFMLSGLLKPHNHPSLIPFISENQPFPAYSLLSFRECSFKHDPATPKLNLFYHKSFLFATCTKCFFNRTLFSANLLFCFSNPAESVPQIGKRLWNGQDAENEKIHVLQHIQCSLMAFPPAGC